ncbi:hypothetical protein DNH61_04870 [Paenibacillus sambharensis]|uniref:Uncharacterized protein n=1 Tax=Paenibacillus sambharensis TaxID=1803190 RepID=A0A2W1LPX4_9BACL|nr:hypothetical protein DNH61_04870 [Paenibacillus sambharensis]
MHPFLTYILFLCSIPLLVLIILLMFYPAFWVFLILAVLGFFAVSHNRQKEKGFLDCISGYSHGDQKRILYIYPDRITIDDIEIICFEKIKSASMHKRSNWVRTGGGFGVKREYKTLSISYINKDGNSSVYTFLSCKNPNNSFDRICEKINNMVGYVPPQEMSQLPHEL